MPSTKLRGNVAKIDAIVQSQKKIARLPLPLLR